MLLQVENLVKYFPISKGLANKKILRAVDGIDIHLDSGEIMGLVGESGSGKSTAGRAILRLIEPDSGNISFDGADILSLRGKALRNMRKNMQMIFQDPYASLNPKLSIGNSLEEAMKYHGVSKKERREIASQLLNEVGMDSSCYNRYPFQFSGGQRQRIGIARALALNPKLIIADEPVSALDVSVQAQVLNLFMNLQEKYRLTYIFISHDLSVIKHICSKVAVMYLGNIVESAPTDELFANPLHPYTKALISAIPIAGFPRDKQERILLKGDIPSPLNPPSGCKFHTRCPSATPVCREKVPQANQHNRHLVCCHLYRSNQND